MKRIQCNRVLVVRMLILFLIAMVPLVIILVYLFTSESIDAATCNNKYKIVIDHDGGADDAMAIFMALLYEKYFDGPEVIGLTTTHGNVNETQNFINSQRILGIASRQDVKIYRGSVQALVNTGYESDYYFGYDGLGDQQNVTFKEIEADSTIAALALVKLSKQHKERLIVVSLGAMTNIALAIKLDPNFIGRLSQLYVVAGNIYGEKYPEPEFNAMMDVEAYHVIADNAIREKVTAIPFSGVLETLNITNDWRLNVLGQIPTKMMQEQNIFEQISIQATSYWCLLDPSAMAVVLNDAMVTETEYSKHDILMCGDKRGINTNDFQSEERNVNVVKAMNKTLFKQFLVDIFSAELNNHNYFTEFY